MKKTYRKYIFRSIKQDLSRLLAIFCIVFLGVSFLVGLMSTAPNLQTSVNAYYKSSNLEDIYIQSTIGFTEDDVKFLDDNVEGIDHIEGYNQLDEFVTYEDSNIESRIIYRTFDDRSIDKLKLIEGRMIENEDEVLALDPFTTMIDIKVDDVILLHEKEYKVVGLVDDPFYMANEFETTTIGNGILDAIFYLDKTLYEPKPTTMIKMTFKESKKLDTFSEEYESYISQKVKDIEYYSKERLEARKDELKLDIEPQIEKAVIKEITNQVMKALNVSEKVASGIVDVLKTTEYFQTLVKETVDDQFNKLFDNDQIKWYVLTRDEIQSAVTFKADSTKVDTISNIFPVFFYLIALLVSLSSMTRMINKDRIYMGTLKSLGYSKGMIYTKYVSYALGASILGAILGGTIGIFVLPYILYIIYGALYRLPPIIFTFQPIPLVVFTSLMVALILVTITILTFVALKEPVSNLMTGKAPVPGKKILLEKWPWLWNKLKFRQKSLLRNVFRFKKNLIMMIIGIGGCTGLLLTGFGIQDSLSVINTDQYQNIIKYDLIVGAKDTEQNPIEGYDNLKIAYYENEVLGQKENIDTFIISSNELEDYIGFDKGIDFNEDSVIITSQISDLLNVKRNNYIALNIKDSSSYTQILVTGVTTNYVGNYIYMGKAAFNKYFPKLTQNAFMTKTDLLGEELDTYVDSLLKNENVTKVLSVATQKGTYDQVLGNLYSVVLIIVLLSGALIAVVIYNLTDIIITERIKEIATLRVCGYKRWEALYYIFKEIIFMSIIGILIGLGVGVLLHGFIIGSIESMGLTFTRMINPLSYLYTILLAVGFISITSLVFYPRIRNINMAESLKSVE